MQRLVPIVAAAAFAMFMPNRADALTITPSSTPQCTSNDTASNTDDSFVQTCANGLYEPDPVLTLLYKQNVGDASDTGSFATSYTTTFSNTPSDPSNAVIDYISGSSISCPICFLLVKDGNQEPAKYAFDISGWNGTDNIDITGFWPGEGAISHVSIYGGPGTGGTGGGGSTGGGVPEPASIALFGFAMLGAAYRLRRQTHSR
jgi:PEP-CTERM motif